MKIVFASANTNKVQEINALIGNQYTILGLSDIGITWEIPEPGDTIKENACLKAQYVAEFLKKQGRNLTVFADDSGLEVNMLNGAPGVHSARYAATPKNDEANNQKLLHELRNITKRKARFVTVIALIQDETAQFFEGEINGTIAYQCRGTNGFGYDPLFIPRGYRSTFAELGPEVKNTISHRALAIKKLLHFLETGTGF